jgi:hypothetical protein
MLRPYDCSQWRTLSPWNDGSSCDGTDAANIFWPTSRLLWLQFDDTVSGRVLTHLRPARTIRDAQLSSLLQRFPILQSIDVSGCTRLTGAWLRDIEHHSTIKCALLSLRMISLFVLSA